MGQPFVAPSGPLIGVAVFMKRSTSTNNRHAPDGDYNNPSSRRSQQKR